jgi:predicted O-linked N-acetylglucosamine transferase (SPINDLY family)
MTVISLQQVMARADALTAQGDTPAAVACYKDWLSSEVSEDVLRHAALFNMGVLLRNLGQIDEAINCYREALKYKPDLYQAAVNLGLAYEAKGNRLEAVQTWIGALQPVDGQVVLLNHLGRVMETAGLLDDAEKYFQRSLLLLPDQPNTVQHFLYVRQKQCKWPVIHSLPDISEEKQLEYCGPLGILALTDDPALQLKTIQGWLSRHLPGEIKHLSPSSGYRHKRIRIGYMSCDFRWHAVSILTAELFELHDRNRFEIYGIDFTPGDNDSMRQRVLAAMDHHLPIHTLTDEQAAQLIRQNEIDILVDLTGLTSGSRYSILAHKPAPIQVSYLGFVGTCGMSEVDYILADRFVFPEELKPHFVEKPLYLPKVYQVNDSKRSIGQTPSRELCGLPRNAFVYCSFNGSYKITPEIFACWMRILKRVQDSVLWLGVDNQWARANLIKEAANQGIDTSRLIFAEKAPPAEYLARYRVADLLLDTSPYNAGTTASDALWAGLPVLTCPGRSFASRMAGALLKAVNMGELITHSLVEYENKAVSLASNADSYKQIRNRLAKEREHSALFDSKSMVRELEILYDGLVNGLGKNRP